VRCPLYWTLSIKEATVFFEVRPLYYALDTEYVEKMRRQEASGFITEVFPSNDSRTSLHDGVLKGATSRYLGSGVSTLEFGKVSGSGHVSIRYAVDGDQGEPTKLVCEYERMADTMKEMAKPVIANATAAVEEAKRSIAALSDAKTDALCKSITTNPYWSRGEWARGLCDAADSATNRAQMLAMFDATTASLAKENRGLEDLRAAYTGELIGLERLYWIIRRTDGSINEVAVFGGFAPTELYADQLERDTRKERCADLGQTAADCKLHAAVEAAFLTKYHDDPHP